MAGPSLAAPGPAVGTVADDAADGRPTQGAQGTAAGQDRSSHGTDPGTDGRVLLPVGHGGAGHDGCQ